MADETEYTEPFVRYTGRADQRILTRRELAGPEAGNAARALIFQPGDEASWDDWVAVTGSKDRAREVLGAQGHEFKLVGPKPEGFDEPAAEFDIGE